MRGRTFPAGNLSPLPGRPLWYVPSPYPAGSPDRTPDPRSRKPYPAARTGPRKAFCRGERRRKPLRYPPPLSAAEGRIGRGRIRTYEGERQRVYSPSPLATWVHARRLKFNREWPAKSSPATNPLRTPEPTIPTRFVRSRSSRASSSSARCPDNPPGSTIAIQSDCFRSHCRKFPRKFLIDAGAPRSCQVAPGTHRIAE